MAKNWKKAYDALALANQELVKRVSTLERDLAATKREQEQVDEMFNRALDAMDGAAENLRGHQLTSSARTLEDLALDLRRRAVV